MKTNTRRRIAALCAAAAISTAAQPAGMTAFADETVGITKKELPLYLYSMDNQSSTECLFLDSLPLVPYMRPETYFNAVLKVEAETVQNGDGTYSVTNANGTLIVDPNADTLTFTDYENFVSMNINVDGTVQESDFVEPLGQFPEGEVRPAVFDLSAYGIDILEEDGAVYVPYSVLNDVSGMTYNAVTYLDGSLYFAHSADMLQANCYFDRSPLYDRLDRTPEMVDFTYRELCFFMDNLYGMPLDAEISESIRQNGFDQSLDTYSDSTRRAKELLHSEKMTDFHLGMGILSTAFLDGGHTVLSMDASLATKIAPDTALGQYWNSMLTAPQTEDEQQAALSVLSQTASAGMQMFPYLDQMKCYAKYEPVKQWLDGNCNLYISGDTAYFQFKSFYPEVLEPFKWSLDYARENGIRNFVLDVSTNQGGSTDVLEYILTIITNADKHNNISKRLQLDVKNGNRFYEMLRHDLDLNGVIDDNDKNVAYDFNFGVLETSTSFSCGNLLPVRAKEDGICILGEEGSGGECYLILGMTAEGYLFNISGPFKTVTASGRAVDLGAEPDYNLKGSVPMEYEGVMREVPSYTKLYDIDAVGDLIEQFYAAKQQPAEPEQPADGQANNGSGSNSGTNTNSSGNTGSSGNTANSSKTGGEKAPATGEAENLALLMLLCIGAAGAAVLSGKKRRI